ncbi:MAG TPA: hypothetical protein VGE98_10975, partial [Thermoanaerobaculia bacterium]
MATSKPQRAAAATAALLITLAGTALPSRTAAAADAAAGVTLDQIMADQDWRGRPPENTYWGDDGRTVYYEQKQTGKELRDLVRLEIDSGKSRIVPPGERGSVDVGGGRLSHDGKKKVYSRKGDLYLKDLTTGEVRQLTRTGDVETDPRFLVGDGRISFRAHDSIYVYDLASGLVSQPADLKLEKDPADEDAPDYLEAQQQRLFDVLRDKKEKERERRQSDRGEQKADATRPPLPWYLGDKIKIVNQSLSPNAEWLLVVTTAKAREQEERSAKRDLMPAYVTESGFAEAKHVRGKVGEDPQAAHQLLLLDLRHHKRHDLDLSVLPGIQDDPLKALREKAEAKEKADKEKWKAERKKEMDEEEYAEAKAAEPAKGEKDKEKDAAKEGKEKEGHDGKKTRPVTVTGISWSDDGAHAAVQLNANDFKDRWIATFDAPAAKLVPRHRLTDPAWVSWAFNDFGWLHESPTLYYLSEESG